jgi:hypothetical protein
MNQVRWLKVKAMAMRGWYKASDGKLYHPVITEKVLEAWAHREKQRARSRKANEVRWGMQNASNGDPMGIQRGSLNDPKGQGQGP